MLRKHFGGLAIISLTGAVFLLMNVAVASDRVMPALDVPMLQSNKGHPLIEVNFPGAGMVDCVVDTGAMAGVAPKAV
ncbi:MAG: hypothetical protein KDI60_03410, partial [Xanthomonadales bacterium]|nr:hypothetical protein [Xanthomonadales bacterium]